MYIQNENFILALISGNDWNSMLPFHISNVYTFFGEKGSNVTSTNTSKVSCTVRPSFSKFLTQHSKIVLRKKATILIFRIQIHLNFQTIWLNERLHRKVYQHLQSFFPFTLSFTFDFSIVEKQEVRKVSFTGWGETSFEFRRHVKRTI